MELLKATLEIDKLVEQSKQFFIIRKNEKQGFLNPFFVYNRDSCTSQYTELNEIGETSITKVFNEHENPNIFVLVGETAIEKTEGGVQELAVFRAYHYLIPEGQLFIQGFEKDENNRYHFRKKQRFAGTDKNSYHNIFIPGKEESSCNAIHLNPTEEFDNRTAILIGHIDEERLLFDVQRFLIDMLHKLSNAQNKKYLLNMEVSKFGKISTELKHRFKEITDFCKNDLLPTYPYVKIDFLLDETASKIVK